MGKVFKGTEKQLETLVCAYLNRSGIECKRQFASSSGIVDILTTGMVIEIKKRLDADNFFRAVGQVLLYRSAIDIIDQPFYLPPNHNKIERRAIIIAAKIDRDLPYGAMRQVGVEVFQWDDEKQKTTRIIPYEIALKKWNKHLRHIEKHLAGLHNIKIENSWDIEDIYCYENYEEVYNEAANKTREEFSQCLIIDHSSQSKGRIGRKRRRHHKIPGFHVQ